MIYEFDRNYMWYPKLGLASSLTLTKRAGTVTLQDVQPFNVTFDYPQIWLKITISFRKQDLTQSFNCKKVPIPFENEKKSFKRDNTKTPQKPSMTTIEDRLRQDS